MSGRSLRSAGSSGVTAAGIIPIILLLPLDPPATACPVAGWLLSPMSSSKQVHPHLCHGVSLRRVTPRCQAGVTRVWLHSPLGWDCCLDAKFGPFSRCGCGSGLLGRDPEAGGASRNTWGLGASLGDHVVIYHVLLTLHVLRQCSPLVWGKFTMSKMEVRRFDGVPGGN